MNFSELCKARYSVRSFADKKIEAEKLDLILNAAKVAPTACNNQPQKLYVLTSETAMQKLSSVSKFVFGAPAAIIFTSDKSKEWKSPFSDEYHTGEIDCSIVCTHAMLQAWESGIGSCWIGYFDPAKIKSAFEIPDGEKVIAILLLGYPAPDAKPSERHLSFRPDGEMIKYL